MAKPTVPFQVADVLAAIQRTLALSGRGDPAAHLHNITKLDRCPEGHYSDGEWWDVVVYEDDHLGRPESHYSPRAWKLLNEWQAWDEDFYASTPVSDALYTRLYLVKIAEWTQQYLVEGENQ